MSATTVAVYIGTCPRCGATRRAVQGGWWPCPACTIDPAWLAMRDAYLSEHPRGIVSPPVLKMRRVRGRVGKAECDAACRSARTEACTCQCGGRHHGEAWALP